MLTHGKESSNLMVGSQTPDLLFTDSVLKCPFRRHPLVLVCIYVIITFDAFLGTFHGVALGHTSSTFVLAYTCPLRYVLDLITHLRFAVQNGTSLRPLFHLSMN